MEGSWVLGSCGKIIIVKVKKDMQDVGGEAVARQANLKSDSTQIWANEEPTFLTEVRGCIGDWANSRHDRVSPHRRAGWASIGGSVRNSLIFRNGLTQVIDFHDFSGFFSWLLWSPFAVLVQFLKVPKQLMQVVDFHDSFS